MNNYISVDDIKNISGDLSPRELDDLIERLNDKVANLVGEEIINSLTPPDVDTLVDMQDSTPEDQLAEWIIERVPDYKEIIEDNKAIVLGEYAESIEEEL